MEAAFARMPRQELFRQTGIQFMRFNSLFQLLALQRDHSPLLEAAETLLFMPDLFHYFFTGEKVNEYTDASTSQMLDPTARTWAARPAASVRPAGAHLRADSCSRARCWGRCARRSRRKRGCTAVPVVAPATHDTAAAVAAVPAQGDAWAYISSGTWSLMGVETAGAAHQRRDAGGQLHQRGRRRRHDAPAEEHHGPVAGAGVPAGVGARRARPTATTS